MIFVFWAAIALVGATIHRWRDKEPRSPRRTAEIYLLWWLVVALGVAAVFGGVFHLVDQEDTAKMIGFTNGDGGFQAEVGFADIAFGVVCILSIWFRGNWWLCALVAITIAYWGDGFGHIHQQVTNDDYAPDNGGLLLISDFLAPAIGLALYAIMKKLGRDESRAGAAST